MMVSSWSRPAFNLNLSAWRRLRRTYDDPVAPLLNVRFHTAGMLFSALARLQGSLFGDALDKLQLKPPIFILGHWRSGTTLLHELLGLDPSFLSPSTFECFNPHHFLLSSGSGQTEAGPMAVRPTGDLVVTASSPQEEEFALLCCGAVSPYEAFLFPEALSTLDKLCDPDQFEEADARSWDNTLVSFLKGVCYCRGRDKRLLLKSPTNSFRVARLEKLFPEATFISLVRESEAVFRSTLAMWEKMWDRYAVGRALQRRALEAQVIAVRALLEAKLEKCASRLPADRFTTARYEDLVADPLGTISRIYDALALGDPSELFPQFENYLSNAQRSRASSAQRKS